jgi:hypothetical protein
LQRIKQLPAAMQAQMAYVANRAVPAYIAAIDAHEAAGQFAKAEPLYHHVVAQARKQLGAGDHRTSSLMAGLGLNLLQQKKYAAAEAVLRECLRIRQRQQPDAWTTFNTKSMLGGSLLDQKKYADAEPLLLQGYEGMKAREQTIPAPSRPRLTQAVQRLVELYDALGQKAKAAEWRQRLAELSKHNSNQEKK